MPEYFKYVLYVKIYQQIGRAGMVVLNKLIRQIYFSWL